MQGIRYIYIIMSMLYQSHDDVQCMCAITQFDH